MLAVSLREFANRSEREILGWLNQPYKVLVTDDEGTEMETTTYDLMLSWYGMVTHRRYNHMPYTVKEIIKSHTYDDGDLQKPYNLFLERLETFVIDPVEIDQIHRDVYAWQTKVNNFLVIFGQAGVVSATATDVTLVFDEPVIADIRNRLRAGEITTDEAETEFKHVVLNHSSLDGYIFIMQLRTGAASINQGFQTVITIGNRFDINNAIIPNPIVPPYAEGIVNLADVLAENRSAGKALNSNGKALEDSEWFHRKLHEVANPVMSVGHLEDCGTKTYIPYEITSMAFLKSLRGKWYFDEKEDKEMLVTRATQKRFKVGDTIHCRSIAFCKSGHAGKPCGRCYGQMKASIPYNVINMRSANPGMWSATAIAERIGQALLSTKHFMRHTTSKPFVVHIGDERYITTDGDNIYLTPEMCQQGTELVFPATMAEELSDLSSIENLDEINEDLLTNFQSAMFNYRIEDMMVPGTYSEQTIHVTTMVSSRRARMSKELIEYVIENGWDKDKKVLRINLANYDYKSPLFFLPYVHEDLNQYRSEVEQFLSLTRRNNVWRQRVVTPEIFGEVVNEFWTLINRKFEGFNIIHAETLLYTITARDPDKGLYGMPTGDEPRYFVPFKHAIENRCINILMTYQGQIKVFENPRTYDIKERQGGSQTCFLANAVL